MTRYIFSLRGISMLAVVLAACAFVTMFSLHHPSDITKLQADPAGVFPALFAHLTPAPISFDHETPFGIHAPWLPAFFTMDTHGVDTDTLVLTNLQVFQFTAVLFVLIGFSGVAGYLRTGSGDAISKMFAGFVRYIRDEMVYPVMGKEHGAHFVPYFLCIFFFIMFQNVFGLLPHSATATASIAVTGALAVLTLGAMIGCGMAAQGPIAFWVHLVPVPFGLRPDKLLLWILLFCIEVIGLLVKPFALTIRLFANMTAGHLIVLSCMGLVMFFAKAGANAAVGFGSAPLAVGFGVFIMIIETFVALLQAYIFTMLSIIFVSASVHPSH